MTRRLVPLLACAISLLPGCARREGTSTRSPVDSLFESGQTLYGDEKFDSAYAIWSVALIEAERRSDERSRARLLTEMGLAQWRLAQADPARATLEQALSIKTRLGMTGELSRSHNALGLVAHSQGRNREALEHFTAAAEAARTAGDSLGEIKALGNVALPAANLGDFETAREAARRLRSAGRLLQDARFEANGLTNEAMVDLYIGDPRPAIARLDTARQLYHRVVYSTGDQVALGQLASAWELTGDYDRGFAALDTALSLAQSLGLREDEAINLRLIADLHSRSGDYRRAIRFYEQSIAIFRETQTGSELGLALRGESAAYLALGNQAHARTSITEAARVHRESGEGREELGDLLLLAEVAFHSAGLSAARPALDSARALATGLGTRGARVDVALVEARLADLAGDSRVVLDVLSRAAPDLSAGDYGAEWEAAALEARALARSGRLEAAVEAGRRAVAAIERQRNALPSDALRSTMLADRVDAYGDLVLALLALGRSGEAFVVADQARSRALLENISAARGDTSGPLPRQLANGDALLRRIDALVQRLRESSRANPQERGPAATSADANLAAELVDARNRYEAILVHGVRKDPRAGAMLGAVTPPVGAVQSALRPGQALIEYLLSSGRLIVFVVTADRINVSQDRLDGAALTARVRLLRDLWGSSRSDWRSGLPAARALHKTLIAPALKAGWLDGVQDLMIVPHGIMGQLPFAALQDDRTGRFLIQDFTVSHLPSAAVLAAAGPSADGEPIPAGGTGFAPFPQDLPASAVEIKAFGTHTSESVLYLGDEASEPQVRRALAGPRLVHVATHGILNGRNPMFSRIELARPGSPEPNNDGRLEVHELLGLTVRSPLVFFSGCQTGAGREWTEDPVLGTADLTLAQAVLTAGASQVISTLWRIDDAGAAAFAGEFYQRLPLESVAGSFALAQRSIASGGKFASPYYWAGYLLSGRNNPARRSLASGSRP